KVLVKAAYNPSQAVPWNALKVQTLPNQVATPGTPSPPLLHVASLGQKQGILGAQPQLLFQPPRVPRLFPQKPVNVFSAPPSLPLGHPGRYPGRGPKGWNDPGRWDDFDSKKRKQKGAEPWAVKKPRHELPQYRVHFAHYAVDSPFCDAMEMPGVLPVLLLSSPGLEEFYRACLSYIDDSSEQREAPEHPTKQIKFLLGKKEDETVLIGGEWSPSLDGPEGGPMVLVRTAIRCTKAQAGLDLSSCTKCEECGVSRFVRTGAPGALEAPRGPPAKSEPGNTEAERPAGSEAAAAGGEQESSKSECKGDPKESPDDLCVLSLEDGLLLLREEEEEELGSEAAAAGGEQESSKSECKGDPKESPDDLCVLSLEDGLLLLREEEEEELGAKLEDAEVRSPASNQSEMEFSSLQDVPKDLDPSAVLPLDALLAFVYFDSNFCGYLHRRDLEKILLTLGLHLCKEQVKCLVNRVVTQYVCQYRNLRYGRHDGPEAAGAERGPEEQQLGNLPLLPPARPPAAVSPPPPADAEQGGLVSHKGTVLNVGKLLEKAEQAESSRLYLEGKIHTLEVKLEESQSRLAATESTNRALAAELRDVQRRLAEVEEQARVSERQKSHFQRLLREHRKRLGPVQQEIQSILEKTDNCLEQDLPSSN
ncbi:PREDICTED: cell cycle and apoptosis regulator protein 2, partial [Tinamus guttatus]|uniref:cell cycle and apoptosis regulator protein 2 n=1 Tax=Tinamus guttatus TaxID=94827 RepID=UPI00052F1CF9